MYEANPEELSEEAIIEAVLNYGDWEDWEDVKKLFSVLGIKRVATIFRIQIRKKRINYSPKTVNYFKEYLKNMFHKEVLLVKTLN